MEKIKENTKLSSIGRSAVYSFLVICARCPIVIPPNRNILTAGWAREMSGSLAGSWGKVFIFSLLSSLSIQQNTTINILMQI
jgi:hypothetical protein